MRAADFTTPMMRQYARLKEENPGTLLLFRCGDFYETYGEDADEAGRLLNIVVTRKNIGADGETSMAGVPFHAIDNYLAKLVRAGRRVAIAEQMEDPKTTKGLVKRDVVRIVTPGTALEESIVDERSNNWIVALARGEKMWGIALADVGTGYFALTEAKGEDIDGELMTELFRLEPREVLVEEGIDIAPLRMLLAERTVTVTRRHADDFREEAARRLLADHFRVHSLDGFGATDCTAGIAAAGALMRYLRETQRTALAHLGTLRVRHRRDTMLLDSVTQRSLELVRNLHDGSTTATLLGVLDRTETPMGARLLRGWMLEPLRDIAAIEARLDVVGAIAASRPLREGLAQHLRGVRDLERIVARVGLGSAGPRDLSALRLGLSRLPALRAMCVEAGAGALLTSLGERIDPLSELRDALQRALVEEPPAFARDGGIFADGWSEELDRLAGLARGAHEWIARFRAQEAERTGIAGLKIGFNKVFGYYIELTNAQMRSLPGGEPPQEYVRRQTVANAERFVTNALKAKEDEVLHAEERRTALEQDLFAQLRETVGARGPAIMADAAAIAEIDCLLSLAQASVRGGYTRPKFNTDGRFEISEGRHPVLESLQRDPPFVPNDTAMSPDARVALITGPNMAGKSTYIRQVALIALMAHLGSFVPARRALVPLRDRIFTRVGAMDHLARGQSTFLVEMTELANILRHATDESLVILDEIGRGTSTYDGLSIAWAATESLHSAEGRRPLALFATHYHELTELSSAMPALRNFHVAAKEDSGRIVFLYRIVPGPTDRSYGIHAAELAGVPDGVVSRAREILSGLEEGRAVAPRVAPDKPGTRPKTKSRAVILPTPQPWEDEQLSLFTAKPNPALDRLRALDANHMTPMEALGALAELRRLAGD